MDVTMEKFEECVAIAREAAMDSIAAYSEPTAPEDAIKMFAEKLTELLLEEQTYG